MNGHIVPIKYHHWSKGLYVNTWRTLDFALGGKFSFFTVRMPNGSLVYPRWADAVRAKWAISDHRVSFACFG